MDEQSLGRLLQSARTSAGLTQQELCQRASISYSTLAKIERGAIKSPSVFTIRQLCEVLGISLDSLLGTTPVAPPIPKKVGRSRSGVTFIYFDINGCLVRFFDQAFTRLAQESGVSAEVIETAFWNNNEQVCKGEMTLDDFNRIMAETCNMMVDWKKYYMEAVEPIPEMHAVVEWASQNYKIGLLSNIMPGFIQEMIHTSLIPDLPYEVIIDSSEVHSVKPDARIFEIARERAGVLASEILLVDDSRANVMAAGQQGWKVLWFKDSRPEEAVARVRQALELAGQTATTPPPISIASL